MNNHHPTGKHNTIATVPVQDDGSVMSELTAETKQSLPVSSPVTLWKTTSEIAQAKNAMVRRASLAGDSRHNTGTTSEEEENFRMKYLPGQSSPRRASLSGPAAYHRPRDHDDEEDDSHRNQYHQYEKEERHAAGVQSHDGRRRRSSFQSNTNPVVGTNAVLLDVAGFTDDADGYGTDNESVVSERSLRRRASIQQRRSSLGLMDSPQTPASSAGGSSGEGVAELLAQVDKQRVYMPRGEEEEEEEEEQDIQPAVEHRATAVPSHSRRGGRRDGSVSEATGAPSQRGMRRVGTGDYDSMIDMRRAVARHNGSPPVQAGAPTQQAPPRGIERLRTSDSVGMQQMQQGLKRAYQHPPIQIGVSQTRRGGRREDSHSTVVVTPTMPSSSMPSGIHPSDSDSSFSDPASEGDNQETRAPQRRVARYVTNDSVTMHNMASGRQDTPPEPPTRADSRQSVRDSVTIQKLRQSHAENENPRRGKRRPKHVPNHWGQGDEKVPPQRGVMRYSTGDSLTMMRDHSSEEDHPGGGKHSRQLGQETNYPDLLENGEENETSNVTLERGIAQVNTADSMELRSARPKHNDSNNDKEEDQEIEYIYVEQEVECSDDENPEEEPQRGVFRTNTTDSADLRAAGHSATRRGHRREDFATHEVSEPRSQSPQEDLDYGYNDDMLTMWHNASQMGLQTRRGSTGIIPKQFSESVVHEVMLRHRFRRASTGQNRQLELCPSPTPPHQSNHMGRRNSSSSMVTTRSQYTQCSHLASYTPSVVSFRELNDMNLSAHGHGAVYLPRGRHNANDSDSEDNIDHDGGAMYGFSGAPMVRRGSRAVRRDSEHSLASRHRSGRHDMRSSKSRKEMKQTAARMSGKGHTEKPEDAEKDSTIYGYGIVSESESSLSESDISMVSRGSRRSSRSLRRNSVVILPADKAKLDLAPTDGADPLGIGGEVDPENDDSKDLLNNSAYLEYAIQPPVPVRAPDHGREKLYAAMDAAQKRRNETPVPKPTHTLKNKDDTWGRSTPFTTPHSSLTKEALEKNFKESGIPVEQSIHKISYHHRTMDIESSDDSSSNGELYRDKEPNSRSEYDEYNQRPRRRDSIDKTIVHMGDLLDKGKKKPVAVPKFTPGVNCTNASDYVVRAFVARLRLGITVIKHNHSRWSKSQQRELVLLPDGRSLTWKPIAGEKDKGRRPKMDLLKCTEVRHAWSKDPDTRKKLGTAVIRSRCKDGSASKSFSLIFHRKTLDMTAMSTDCCKMMMEGFSALCFRLQMDKLNHREDEGDHNASENGTGSHYARSVLTDDDWNSTVFESTMSKTQSTQSMSAFSHNSPWGL